MGDSSLSAKVNLLLEQLGKPNEGTLVAKVDAIVRELEAANGEEVDQGTDPFNAYDVPYIGGWKKDSCRDEVDPTGNGVGEVAEDFGLVDQYGDRVYLHDFCNRVVLIEFAGFT